MCQNTQSSLSAVFSSYLGWSFSGWISRYQNPREVSSRSRIFLISLVYMWMYVLCHASWPNEKRYRPEIRHTYSHWPYLKRVFGFFEEITLTAASLDKLPCHMDFRHISSIALFLILSQSQANFQIFVRSFPSPFSREQLQSELIFIINNISVSLCWKGRYSCCIFLEWGLE